MIKFECMNEDHLEKVVEIVNSNFEYNRLENGKSFRTKEEIKQEFFNDTTESFIVIMNDEHVGIIDFLHHNPKDFSPWIGLVMIHRKYHSRGYGKKAYLAFEKKLNHEKYSKVRLGVLQENIKAREYWSSLDFICYGQGKWNEKMIDCFEKIIT